MKEYTEPYITAQFIFEYIRKEKTFVNQLNNRILNDYGNSSNNLQYVNMAVEWLEDNGMMEVTGQMKNVYSITVKGKEIHDNGGMQEYFKSENDKIEKLIRKEKEEAELRRYNIKNAKRVYKTYWWTFGFSITALIISLILAYYKLFVDSK